MPERYTYRALTSGLAGIVAYVLGCTMILRATKKTQTSIQLSAAFYVLDRAVGKKVVYIDVPLHHVRHF